MDSRSSQCMAETYERDLGVRCAHQGKYGGYCYYHRKMVDGLITPSKEVQKVVSVTGQTIYVQGQKARR